MTCLLLAQDTQVKIVCVSDLLVIIVQSISMLLSLLFTGVSSVSGGGNPTSNRRRIRDLSGWLDHAISQHGATLGAKETGIFHLCQETWIFHGIFP